MNYSVVCWEGQHIFCKKGSLGKPLNGTEWLFVTMMITDDNNQPWLIMIMIMMITNYDCWQGLLLIMITSGYCGWHSGQILICWILLVWELEIKSFNKEVSKSKLMFHQSNHLQFIALSALKAEKWFSNGCKFFSRGNNDQYKNLIEYLRCFHFYFIAWLASKLCKFQLFKNSFLHIYLLCYNFFTIKMKDTLF